MDNITYDRLTSDGRRTFRLASDIHATRLHGITLQPLFEPERLAAGTKVRCEEHADGTVRFVGFLGGDEGCWIFSFIGERLPLEEPSR